ENVGYGDVSLPHYELHTRALWLDPPAPPGPRANHADAGARAAHALEHVAALLVVCDPGDLRRAGGGPGSPEHLPRIYLFRAVPGGAGFCGRLHEARADLVARAARLVASCRCRHGCPGCVGPIVLADASPKGAAGAVLESLR